MRRLLLLLPLAIPAIAAWTLGGAPTHPPAESTESYRALHERHVRRFIAAGGFGFGRMAPDDRHLLIGAYRHDPPRVYTTTISKKHLHRAPTRTLTAIERRAMARLAAGSDVVREGPVLVGAIRARASCLDCHGVGEGDLLGAFVYELASVR